MEENRPVARSSACHFARRIQFSALALALLASGVGIGAFASAAGSIGRDADGNRRRGGDGTRVPMHLYGPDSEPWVRGELYFGTTNPNDKAEYSVEEWDAFLDAEITPRFPAGLTVVTGLGQYQNASGEVVQERSEVLILLYPRRRRGRAARCWKRSGMPTRPSSSRIRSCARISGRSARRSRMMGDGI